MNWKKFKPKIINALESDYKMVVLRFRQNAGKTGTTIIHCVNNNHNNLFFLNNHELKFEIIKKMITSGYNGQIKVPFWVNYLYGKHKLIPEEEMLFFGYPRSACPLFFHNRYLWQISHFGFLPADYCSKRCPFRYDCLYKQLKESFYYSVKPNHLNFANILMKSHIGTGMVDGYLEKADHTIGMFDENTFGLICKQKNFNPHIIERFREGIEKILYDKKMVELYDFWDSFSRLLLEIKEYILHRRSIKPEKKEQLITKNILEFMDSYSLKDVIKFNEELKSIFISNVIKLKFSNFIDSFIEIIDDFRKLKKVEEKICKYFILDDKKEFLIYYMNTLGILKRIINKLEKVIFTDATFKESFIEPMFPEYLDDYIITGNGYKNYFKEVIIDNYKYHKPSLWNPSQQRPTETFNNIVLKKLGWILKEFKDEKIFFSSFKCFKPYIKRKHKDILNKINYEYDYFQNLEGKNRYSDGQIAVVVGSPGWPKRVVDMFADVYGFERQDLIDLSTIGQIIQTIERVRPADNPYQKTAIIITNEAKDYFPDAKDFSMFLKYKYIEKYNDIYEYIRRNEKVSANNIKEALKYKKDKVYYALNKLVKYNIIGFVSTQLSNTDKTTKLYFVLK